MISYEEKRKQFSDEAQKRIQNRAQEIKDELHIIKEIEANYAKPHSNYS
ncbi:hypothetical protein CAL7716_003110 [Calothrix sp. PCC 7716]|nr:hypothetical protein CAL7716_003110 [Calothrix sp. PCC 7716]